MPRGPFRRNRFIKLKSQLETFSQHNSIPRDTREQKEFFDLVRALLGKLTEMNGQQKTSFVDHFLGVFNQAEVNRFIDDVLSLEKAQKNEQLRVQLSKLQEKVDAPDSLDVPLEDSDDEEVFDAKEEESPALNHTPLFGASPDPLQKLPRLKAIVDYLQNRAVNDTRYLASRLDHFRTLISFKEWNASVEEHLKKAPRDGTVSWATFGMFAWGNGYATTVQAIPESEFNTMRQSKPIQAYLEGRINTWKKKLQPDPEAVAAVTKRI